MGKPDKHWIVLIRGINVGGRHVVRMKELAALMTSAGIDGVRTYIQSGNIVCAHAESPDRKVAGLIEQNFGFRPEVFALQANEFRKTIAACPYPADAGKAVHFFFLDRKPDVVDVDLLDALKSASEDYTLANKVLYLYAPDGIGRSKLVEKIGKAFPGISMTARNLNTINKLLDML